MVISLVSFRGIWWTLKTVKNPWAVALIYLDNKPRLVKFKDGFSEVTSRNSFLRFRSHILHGWRIKRADNKYLLCKDDFKIFAPLNIEKCGLLFEAFEELEECYKVFDFTEKVCLDVGGFIGETAVLFKLWGARKVIIYEPSPENCEFIRLNTELNDVNAEIHCMGVSDHDGTLEVNYDDFSVRFGLGNGHKKVVIPTFSVSKVLSENIDIAKFDCEGCERAILTVPADVLKKIPAYVVEYHHGGGKKLVEKFHACGFNVEFLSNSDKPIGIFKAWL
jgi:FkbM family methyltransferase